MDGGRGEDAAEATRRAADAPDAGEAEAREALEAEVHDLIRRAQGGDEWAFQDLLRMYERRAWRVARNMVPSDEDARDLVQEAFLRVFRNLDRFDFEHAFSTWLYRIVTNLAIDHLRKRRPAFSTTPVDEEEGERELLDHRAEAPSARMERDETADEVRACLDALAPHFQSVLVLRELEGLSCSEIADIVGATNVTVRWRLHRGRKLFQDEWERRRRLKDKGLLPDANVGLAAGVDPAEEPEEAASGARPAEDPSRQ